MRGKGERILQLFEGLPLAAVTSISFTAMKSALSDFHQSWRKLDIFLQTHPKNTKSFWKSYSSQQVASPITTDCLGHWCIRREHRVTYRRPFQSEFIKSFPQGHLESWESREERVATVSKYKLLSNKQMKSDVMHCWSTDWLSVSLRSSLFSLCFWWTAGLCDQKSLCDMSCGHKDTTALI